MTNGYIREKLKECGVKQWELAEACGINEFTLSRWLRHELPDNKQSEMMRLIEQIAKGRERV